MKTYTLTTRRDELCIGGNIRISVGQAEGRRARIAIDAPRWVQVDRAEVRGSKLDNAEAQPTSASR